MCPSFAVLPMIIEELFEINPYLYVIDHLSQCQSDLSPRLLTKEEQLPYLGCVKCLPLAYFANVKKNWELARIFDPTFQRAGKRGLIRRNTVFFIEKYRIHPLYSFGHQTYKRIDIIRNARH